VAAAAAQQGTDGERVHHLIFSSACSSCPSSDMYTLFLFRQMMVQQMLLDAYEHRHSLQEAEAFMLHGHAANNNVPLLQSKCPNIQTPSSLSVSRCRPLGVFAL